MLCMRYCCCDETAELLSAQGLRQRTASAWAVHTLRQNECSSNQRLQDAMGNKFSAVENKTKTYIALPSVGALEMIHYISSICLLHKPHLIIGDNIAAHERLQIY